MLLLVWVPLGALAWLVTRRCFQFRSRTDIYSDKINFLLSLVWLSDVRLWGALTGN
jgi:hypothetical protein